MIARRGCNSVIAEHPTYRSVYNTAVGAGATAPSDEVRRKQNRLYRDWSAAGILAVLDILYVWTHDGNEQFGFYNWLAPASHTITKVGTLTFTARDGVKGNGTTGYYNSNFSAISNGANFAATQQSVMAMVKESTAVEGFLIGRTDSGSTKHVWLRGRLTGDTAELRLVQDTNFLPVAGITDGAGFWYGDRVTTLLSLYRNNTLISSRNDVPGAVSRPAGAIFLFARAASAGGPDNFSVATIRFLGLGGPLSSDQRTLMLDAWNLYFNSL